MGIVCIILILLYLKRNYTITIKHISNLEQIQSNGNKTMADTDPAPDPDPEIPIPASHHTLTIPNTAPTTRDRSKSAEAVKNFMSYLNQSVATNKSMMSHTPPPPNSPPVVHHPRIKSKSAVLQFIPPPTISKQNLRSATIAALKDSAALSSNAMQNAAAYQAKRKMLYKSQSARNLPSAMGIQQQQQLQNVQQLPQSPPIKLVHNVWSSASYATLKDYHSNQLNLNVQQTDCPQSVVSAADTFKQQYRDHITTHNVGTNAMQRAAAFQSQRKKLYESKKNLINLTDECVDNRIDVSSVNQTHSPTSSVLSFATMNLLYDAESNKKTKKNNEQIISRGDYATNASTNVQTRNNLVVSHATSASSASSASSPSCESVDSLSVVDEENKNEESLSSSTDSDIGTESSSYDSELNSDSYNHLSAKYHGEEQKFPFEDENQNEKDESVKITESQYLCNMFLSKHNGAEPTNEWALHQWIESQTNVKNIPFQNARELFLANKDK